MSSIKNEKINKNTKETIFLQKVKFVKFVEITNFGSKRMAKFTIIQIWEFYPKCIGKVERK